MREHLNKKSASNQPRHQPQISLVFMGTPKFACPTLRALIRNGYRILAVVTGPDKPSGRDQKLIPGPVKKIALKYKIPLFQPTKLSEITSRLSFLKPHLIVVAAYGQILPQEILDIPKYGCLNIHPSLLPQYRGPSPIQSALLNGEKETGVTVMLMNEKIDQGPILAQSRTTIKPEETSGLLKQRLAQRGAWLLIKTLPKFIRGKIQPWPQKESQASQTKILFRQDGQIFWNKGAEEIERQIRAFDPWPGTFSRWSMVNGQWQRLKILKGRVVSCLGSKRNYGEVFVGEKGEIMVQTGDGCLVLEKVQLEGGKPMSGQDFLRGHKDIIGSVLK